MDNKQDRQFYWEVKDFMSGKHTPSTPKIPKVNVVDSVKNILEHNKVYKQSSFNPNINTPNVIRQAINAMESAKKAGNPNSPAFTKNVDRNAFAMLKEATAFDKPSVDISFLIAACLATASKPFNPSPSSPSLVLVAVCGL